MRRILVDHARTKQAEKRGGGAALVELNVELDVSVAHAPTAEATVIAFFQGKNVPLLSRGGVAARSIEKVRSDLIPRRRGGAGQPPHILFDHHHPGRSFQRLLRDILLRSRPPLLG